MMSAAGMLLTRVDVTVSGMLLTRVDVTVSMCGWRWSFLLAGMMSPADMLLSREDVTVSEHVWLALVLFVCTHDVSSLACFCPE